MEVLPPSLMLRVRPNFRKKIYLMCNLGMCVYRGPLIEKCSIETKIPKSTVPSHEVFYGVLHIHYFSVRSSSFYTVGTCQKNLNTKYMKLFDRKKAGKQSTSVKRYISNNRFNTISKQNKQFVGKVKTIKHFPNSVGNPYD